MGATKFNFWQAALAKRQDRKGISPHHPSDIHGVGGDEEAGNEEEEMKGTSSHPTLRPDPDPAGIFGDFSEDEEEYDEEDEIISISSTTLFLLAAAVIDQLQHEFTTRTLITPQESPGTAPRPTTAPGKH